MLKSLNEPPSARPGSLVVRPIRLLVVWTKRGSLAGVLYGFAYGSVIPFVGSIIGAVLGFAAGTAVGVVCGVVLGCAVARFDPTEDRWPKVCRGVAVGAVLGGGGLVGHLAQQPNVAWHHDGFAGFFAIGPTLIGLTFASLTPLPTEAAPFTGGSRRPFYLALGIAAATAGVFLAGYVTSR